ncbi:MAG: hypothetical protein DDT26_02414 [Dehalococcoidia bacterium]|nr:hypothetical protein [Chloroflexota bacterium]
MQCQQSQDLLRIQSCFVHIDYTRSDSGYFLQAWVSLQGFPNHSHSVGFRNPGLNHIYHRRDYGAEFLKKELPRYPEIFKLSVQFYQSQAVFRGQSRFVHVDHSRSDRGHFLQVRVSLQGCFKQSHSGFFRNPGLNHIYHRRGCGVELVKEELLLDVKLLAESNNRLYAVRRHTGFN